MFTLGLCCSSEIAHTVYVLLIGVQLLIIMCICAVVVKIEGLWTWLFIIDT